MHLYLTWLPIDSSLVNAEWNNNEDSLLELINQYTSVFFSSELKNKAHRHISLSQSPPAPFFLSISPPQRKMRPLELPPKTDLRKGGGGEGGGGKEGKVTHHRPLAFHKMHTH